METSASSTPSAKSHLSVHVSHIKQDRCKEVMAWRKGRWEREKRKTEGAKKKWKKESTKVSQQREDDINPPRKKR